MRQADTFFFVHIPKTAGTSLREALELALGRDRCELDYGLAAPETTALVREHMLLGRDPYALQRAMAAAGKRLLTGHIPLARYAPLVGATQVLSFVRHPETQLMSHIAHLHRHSQQHRDISLANFLTGAMGVGLQTHMLAGAPLAALGVIGVTERYDDSLRAIRTAHGLKLEARRSNLNPGKTSGETYEPLPALSPELAQRHDQDQRLYTLANRLLDARLKAIDEGYPYVNGAITLRNARHVNGFAFQADSDSAVKVELHVNGECIQTELATVDRPPLRTWHVPRNGFVGFNFKLEHPLTPEDKVLVCVAETGQRLLPAL